MKEELEKVFHELEAVIAKNDVTGRYGHNGTNLDIGFQARTGEMATPEQGALRDQAANLRAEITDYLRRDPEDILRRANEFLEQNK